METERVKLLRVESDGQIARCAALADVIWHECFAKLLSAGQIDYMVANFQSAAALTRQIREEGYEYYLLHFGGGAEPGGYVGVRAADGKLMLSKFYFLAEHRGRHYARDVLGAVERLARERGANGVWLTVNRHNERAIAVYRATGFSVSREQVTDIGGGYVMDDFVFEKPL